MKSVRFVCGFIVLAGLGACGFRPVHAPLTASSQAVALTNIAVEMGENEKINFLLTQALRDRMGQNADAAYILKTKPDVQRMSLGISAQDVASRYDLKMNTKFELVERQSGKTVYAGEVQTVSTFGAPTDPYGTVTAQNNAEAQLAHEAADRIILRLAGFNAKSTLK